VNAHKPEHIRHTGHLDVLIVGAGISGIGAAVHLQKRCPNKRFAILERRTRVGGTWDLFRYPGVRSDSDMYTLGFRFKPWTNAKAIADGPAIRAYVEETAREYNLVNKIRFDHHVIRSTWSSEDAKWTVELETGPDRDRHEITCNFLFMCGGYYNYDAGFLPEFVDQNKYTGKVVHPQHWPEDLDYQHKKVVVIGSGATAVTLVPAMASSGATHVTMLQRSPTYMVTRPSEDALANKMNKYLPHRAAYVVTRWRNVLRGQFFFNIARRKPDQFKAKLLEGVRAELGPDYDVATHFTPRYKPWDQRLCLVPDSDMFKALRDGSASITTGQIERFTEKGVRLVNGEELEADIIVTATGLNLQMLGGMEVIVDGRKIDVGETVLHKGIMFSGVPNLAMWFGYTNASWTLKADLTSDYMCRMLKYMDEKRLPIVMPTFSGKAAEDFVDFSSGYFARSQHLLPKQGSALPWKLNQNYIKDLRLLRHGRIDDEGLVFSDRQAVSVRS
jgi:monooxygenase